MRELVCAIFSGYGLFHRMPRVSQPQACWSSEEMHELIFLGRSSWTPSAASVGGHALLALACPQLRSRRTVKRMSEPSAITVHRTASMYEVS